MAPARKPRERIYIVPRWPAVVFAVIVLLVFALGFAYPPGRGLTQTLGIALLVAVVVTLIQTNENLRGLDLTDVRAAPVPSGGEVEIEITLKNQAGADHLGLQLREAMRLRRAWRARPVPTAALPLLAGGATEVVRLRLPAGARGRHPLPSLWVCSIQPVGLCFAWKRFSPQGSFSVYPRPRGEPLERAARDGRDLEGGASQGSEDVSGHRPYAPGDPLSRLDWRVFARSGKLAVRTLEEGSGGEVVLRWEDTRFLPDVETRLEQMSAWLAQCVREGRPFSMHLEGWPGELGHRNVTACQEALALHGKETS